jgi:xanthine/uracil permease
VIALLIGLAVAAVASAPALLFAWGSREVTDFKQRLKLWAIGLAIRFAIIDGALFYLFVQTSIARVPVIIGVAIGYVIFYTLESMVTLRAKK